jgi:hypothetical protein
MLAFVATTSHGLDEKGLPRLKVKKNLPVGGKRSSRTMEPALPPSTAMTAMATAALTIMPMITTTIVATSA